MAPEFSVREGAWRDQLGLVRDVVRQELVWRQLAGHLPDPCAGKPVRVLDVGCGQGTQLVRLAAAGYHVTGVDPSRELLDMAARAVAAAGYGVEDRVALHEGNIGTLGDVGDSFDAVCCHGVVMYLPSLKQSLATLLSVVTAGGLASVLSKNRANLALRAALAQDWTGALDAFDARQYTNRLGVQEARADDPEEVISTFEDLGARLVAWYGVRLFTDHWGDVSPPDDIEIIVQAEQKAGASDPYRLLCSATHVLVRRQG